ncbi:MAG: 3,4-dihydroxy-2-butanone-4-phosphate synthase [Deltaproteobacteria bacterium]|nr:MAG: 3,4-dihydroxy-2-butanone-4-phosphate synthase [Deltaproteobacteria bacterium]
MSRATMDETIAAIRRGEMVILVDDEDRENEGDLVVAAEKVTPEIINFMAKFGRGLICLSLTDERLRELQIPLMVEENSAQFGTAFTVSIEARDGVTTGISAADRAHTIQVAVADTTRPEDLVRPGHIFPLRARRGGVLERTGQTEGSVDLARLAGLKPAAVICEILNDDGSMARMEDLEVFAREHGLLIATVEELIQYRLQRDTLVERVLETPYPCRYHDGFRVRGYRSVTDGTEHLALVLGDPSASEEPVAVRVQHQCTVGDVFMGTACGCGWQLHGAMEEIARRGCGVLVYLHKPELSRLDAVRRYVMTEGAREEDSEEARQARVNTVSPEFRDLGVGAQIVRDCGVRSMILLSSSERRLVGLDGYGLELVDQIPIPPPSWKPVP